MPKTSSRPHSTSDTKEARLMALENFPSGACVRHRLTGQMGLFRELNLGYDLPEVWVQFESETDIRVPTSCNPLDLELIESTKQQMEEISSDSESAASSETVVTVEATDTTVEVLEELTFEEVSERHRLELKVERAFYEAGKALQELRDLRLYRSTHKTFKEYCRERFGFTRFSAYNKIAAASVFENLLTIGQQILPANERQVRDLTNLEPDEQQQVWQKAINLAGGKVPSGRIVKGIVERLKAKPLFKATDFCQIGDVFTLIGLTDGERKYNTCWAIASDVRDFTVMVDVHDGTIAVKPENLKPIDAPDTRCQLPQILKRIRRLRDQGLLDCCAYTILESLGRQTYLTEVQEKVLSCLEEHYKVHS